MTALVENQTAREQKRLAGKNVLITGGSRGIGAGIALRLAEEGATVILTYNGNKKGADEVVSQIETIGGKALALKGNVTSEEEVADVVKNTIERIGKIHILINNAGVYEGAPLEQITPEHYSRVFDVNIKGVIATTVKALPHIADGGRIINVSSVAAKGVFPGSSIYAASKAALSSLTATWAQELGQRGITVNAVGPGTTQSDMFEAAIPEEMRASIKSQTALGRIGQPEDIAALVAFLASDDGRWITGQTIYADGGLKF